MRRRHRLLRNQKGVSLLEYVLLMALLAVVGITAFSDLGIRLTDFYNDLSGEIPLSGEGSESSESGGGGESPPPIVPFLPP